MLVAVAAVPFVAVWNRQFTNWDDRPNIVENGAVRWLSLPNVGYLVTHAIGGNYVPLTWLSHALDWRIAGDDAWGHALTNAFWHAVCCCLVVACLRRGGLDAAPAWLAGFLFAVHPVHAENVAWLSGRKDLLCAAALLACQWTYMGWRINSRRSSWLASLFWLLAAGLSKPMAMSAVIGLGLYDVLWLRRPVRDACRSLLPHAVLCAAVALIAVLAQRSGSAIAGAADRRWGALDLAACNLLYELWRCWLPLPFSPFIPNSVLEDLPDWLRWLGTAVLAGASAALAFQAYRSRSAPDAPVLPGSWAAFGWWWFAGLAFLLPVSGLIPLGHTSLADRYLYLPSLGPCIFLAVSIAGCTRRFRCRAGFAIAPVLVLALAWITHQRAAPWADSDSLWRATLAVYPRSALAWQKLTSAYFLDQRLDEAAAIARQGLQTVPDDMHVRLNAAVLLTDLGRFSEAEDVLAAGATTFRPSPDILNQRGILALRRGEPAAARALFESAANGRPQWEQPPLNLSYVFEQEHDLPAALAAVRQAIALASHDPEARRRLVELLWRDHRTEEAFTALQEMIAAFPRDADAWRNRITLLRQAGRTAEAEQAARDAARFVSPEQLRN